MRGGPRRASPVCPGLGFRVSVIPATARSLLHGGKGSGGSERVNDLLGLPGRSSGPRPPNPEFAGCHVPARRGCGVTQSSRRSLETRPDAGLLTFLQGRVPAVGGRPLHRRAVQIRLVTTGHELWPPWHPPCLRLISAALTLGRTVKAGQGTPEPPGAAGSRADVVPARTTGRGSPRPPSMQRPRGQRPQCRPGECGPSRGPRPRRARWARATAEAQARPPERLPATPPHATPLPPPGLLQGCHPEVYRYHYL